MWSSNFSLQVLVFASINRFCMCLKKKNQKQYLSNFFCSLSSAYIICIVICIIWALISLHYLMDFAISNNYCAPKNIFIWGIKFSSIYLCQSILLIIFGILTIIYRQKRTIFIRRNEPYERHPVETQLTSMIITEIILVILSSLPYTIYIIYRLITIERNRNSIDIMYENIIERLIRLTIFFEASCGFYIYLFTLTSLKKRFLHILRRKLRH
ncbi:unnamed protein product [Adineta steineri]|uniref:G-protein coupled receptors family 1 profile domain-containing protein n=1 Tax=Adineta steineri TaxID=433720 RepID=A0A814BUH4_9BILA|nr:unnamed protein product [Adineta steineri]CAF1570153.1 unnamed protein product [Adineta steineri]